MLRFEEYLAAEKKKQVEKVTTLYLLFGIPVILIFALSDSNVIGIERTIYWRGCGLLPMLVSAVVYLRNRITSSAVNLKTARFLLVAMIAGVSTMMAAIYFMVVLDDSSDVYALAGTIAGNLLVIFTISTLNAVSVRYVAASLCLPYIIVSLLLAFSGEMNFQRWVFTGNILTAIPLVLLIINGREKTDNQRLDALYKLETRRQDLELAVAERTSELESLLKELHHRVRNNLQIILSIINLYENNYPAEDSTDRRIGMIRKAVRIMADAHTLSSDGLIIEKIDMRLFFSELCSDTYCRETGNTVYAIDDILLDLQTAVVLGFISIHLIPDDGSGSLISLELKDNVCLFTISVENSKAVSQADYNFVLLLSELINCEVESGFEELQYRLEIGVLMDIEDITSNYNQDKRRSVR